MRADRLIRLILLLQNEGKMTTAQLSQRLEVSERTIVRDMDALSSSGIPVYADRGNRGGWKLSEGYRTRLTGLKTNELASLLISPHSQLLRDLGMDISFRDAQQKLLATSKATIYPTIQSIRSKIHIDGVSWYHQDQSAPNLEHIQEALFTERKLCIVYKRDGEMKPVKRILCPLGLIAKQSVWYIVGLIEQIANTEQAKLRTYRVSRIQSVSLLNEQFTSPENFDLASYWEQSKQQFRQALPHYKAKIRVRSSLLPRIEQERFIHILQKKDCDNDWWELEMDLATPEYACNLLLSWRSDARVIEPPELKQQVIEEAHQLLAAYEHE